MRNGKQQPPINYVRVPVLGEVFAGRAVPVDALEITSWREIRPIKGARPGDRFAAAPVRGDSLIDDGILEGDFVIFRLTQTAEIGDLIIVLTPDGITIKYLSAQADGLVLLRGANDLYADQVWEARQLKIQGVVKRMERDL